MEYKIGEKFGVLTLQENIDAANLNTKCLFICDCGKNTVKQFIKAKYKPFKSCSLTCDLRVENISGKKHGMVLVLNEFRRAKPKGKNGCIHWKCRCDCGNEFWGTSTQLRRNKRTSCGKCFRFRFKESQPQNIIGKRFGMLLALEEYKKNDKGVFIQKFKCDCGNIKWIPTLSITKNVGRTKSCGCLKKQLGKNNRNWKGFGDIFAARWFLIKDSASKRGIEFLITIEYAWNQFLKQNRMCALTGKELFFNYRLTDFTGTASLDRIDSNKGYTEGNVQWVHKYVNIMKQDFDQDYFIQKCEEVAQHQQDKLYKNWNIVDLARKV